MKTCTDCLETLELSEFSSNQEYPRNQCKRCVRARRPKGKSRRTAEGQAAQKERSRRRHFLKNYGLSVEEVEELKVAQSGRCAACGERKTLVVDHSHETGEVRELLCQLCNTQLGVLENAERYALLRAYLERHQTRS